MDQGKVRSLANAISAKKGEASIAWSEFESARSKALADNVDLSKNPEVAARILSLSKTYDKAAEEVASLEESMRVLMGTSLKTRPVAPAWARKAASELVEGKAANSSAVVRVDAAEVFATPAATHFVHWLVGEGDSSTGVLHEYLRISQPNINAAPVAPGALKPSSSPDISRVRAEWSTIAHLYTLQNQLVSDHEMAPDIVNEVMGEGIISAIDDQALNGDGTGPNLLGIFNTPGIATVTQTATESPIDVLLRASTTVRLGKGIPNLFVVSPATWETIILCKDSTGRYLVDGGPVDANLLRLWGHSVCVSDAIDDSHALVLDTSHARLITREEMKMEWSQHGEAFSHNEVLARMEWRGTVQWTRPSTACDVIFD